MYLIFMEIIDRADNHWFFFLANYTNNWIVGVEPVEQLLEIPFNCRIDGKKVSMWASRSHHNSLNEAVDDLLNDDRIYQRRFYLIENLQDAINILNNFNQRLIQEYDRIQKPIGVELFEDHINGLVTFIPRINYHLVNVGVRQVVKIIPNQFIEVVEV